ncbi:NAD(P)H-dependent oxidoreductase [Rubellimicrobium rubrum]|uniref:NAD(P)H-dependent oxidoreductase n=1 Tax=Rubellimicrobium rubrum TaxID=2585369 RepID=A0A5C4MXN0_9RHOB|nr:NAD(P)H-dependent oxidoreductase [Rubellimicrobium rubrum]TNC49379.1 NAD(P)H-dependent oxidoreductase [Rubellimicrobium rubrum]
MAPKLNIVIGSTRPGRVGPTIGQWLAEAASAHGLFEVELVDLAEVGLPLLDEPAHPRLQQYQFDHTKRWSQSVASADAFLFVTPEYDYFPPAALINAVQVLAKEWGHKPAGVVSYGGISGGLRAAQVLRQLLSNVNMHALPQTVPVPMFFQHIQDGAFHPTEPVATGTTALLDDLHKWAIALKALRVEEAQAAQTKAA